MKFTISVNGLPGDIEAKDAVDACHKVYIDLIADSAALQRADSAGNGNGSILIVAREGWSNRVSATTTVFLSVLPSEKQAFEEVEKIIDKKAAVSDGKELSTDHKPVSDQPL